VINARFEGQGIPLILLGKEVRFGRLGMATWQDEFIRLSELHRNKVERWLEGTRNANLVIDAGESEKAFLLRWLAADEPSRNEQMPQVG